MALAANLRSIEQKMSDMANKENDNAESEPITNPDQEAQGEDMQTPNETENLDTASVSENDAEKKLTELNDKYLRLYSDFDNFRKRTLKEKAEIISSAGSDVI